MHAIISRFESGGKLREVLRRFHGEKADTTFYNWAHTWISEHFMTWRMADDLARIRCPVQAIFGAKDEYGNDHLIAHLRNDLRVPPAITVLDEAAHIPHHEDRAGTLAALVPFITATLATASVRA
jgi:pimeloyl-ACP methyl ester carboxylesterase